MAHPTRATPRDYQAQQGHRTGNDSPLPGLSRDSVGPRTRSRRSSSRPPRPPHRPLDAAFLRPHLLALHTRSAGGVCVMDLGASEVPASGPASGGRSTSPTVNASWAWATAGSDTGASSKRFVSPFLQHSNSNNAPQSQVSQQQSHSLVDRTSPHDEEADFQTYSRDRYGTPTGFQPQSDVTPRSARSPIGTKSSGGHMGQQMGRGSALNSYVSGVSLTLQDDADIGSKMVSHTVKEDEHQYLSSPFANPNLSSLTASPMSTPSFAAHSHDPLSPSSPSESYSHSIPFRRLSRAMSRV